MNKRDGYYSKQFIVLENQVENQWWHKDHYNLLQINCKSIANQLQINWQCLFKTNFNKINTNNNRYVCVEKIQIPAARKFCVITSTNFWKSPGRRCTGTDHLSVHVQFKIELWSRLNYGMCTIVHMVFISICKKRPMVDFQLGRAGYRSRTRTGDNPPPGRRAGPADCSTTAMAGNFFTYTNIHTHLCSPNDFTE